MGNVVHDIMETVQKRLADAVDLTSTDEEVTGIEESAIVIRKVALREQDYEVGHLVEAKPGILIVYRGQNNPKNGGTNGTDDIYYDVDLIIVDNDNHSRNAGIKTYTQWQQNIRQYFSHKLDGWPSTAADGIVWDVWALSSEAVNDWRWNNEGEVVMGVRLQFVSREPTDGG